MSVKHRLSKPEQRAAARRVRQEGIRPLAELAPLVGHTEDALRRWVIEGKGQVHMDGFRRPGIGWVSSEAALWRFLQATADE